MTRYVMISYSPAGNESSAILESAYVSEDEKYLYLESGKYLKKYIDAMQSRIEGEDDSDDEDQAVI